MESGKNKVAVLKTDVFNTDPCFQHGNNCFHHFGVQNVEKNAKMLLKILRSEISFSTTQADDR
jgi:hypothetical protein